MLTFNIANNKNNFVFQTGHRPILLTSCPQEAAAPLSRAKLMVRILSYTFLRKLSILLLFSTFCVYLSTRKQQICMTL